MKELLTYIVRNLVENPNAVSIIERVSVVETGDGKSADNLTLEVRVDKSDMGKIIGRHGRVAKEIRTIMKTIGSHQNKCVTVEILD